MDNNLNEFPPGTPIRLQNVICPYCGIALDATNKTREHVVGRRFVPRGTLDKHWNLILNACAPCNNRKSDLEDDISAITMQPDVLGHHFSEHEQLVRDAARKGEKTISRHTGKPISQSKSTIEFKYHLGPGTTLTFNMVGQPNIDDHRVFELALRHFQAFFYLITYDERAKRGWWWKGAYVPIQFVSKNDWGNETAVSFMQNTRDWDIRVLANTAEEHFKLVIRKNILKDVWSLAAEWNQNYRILAACGEGTPVSEFLSRLAIPKSYSQTSNDGVTLHSRIECPLRSEEDILFSYEPQATRSSAT